MADFYDYKQAVKDDIRQWIDDNVEPGTYKSRDDMDSGIYDDLFVDDQVTGNGSGSYWFNRADAEKVLYDGLDYLGDAIDEYGSTDCLREGAEACDVTIRCYLLGECLSDVLDDLESEGYFGE